MGRPKALLGLTPESDQTFLQALVAKTAGLARQAIVSSLPETQLGVELPTVKQRNPDQGQLSSLLLGWDAFGQQAEWVMVCLVDHPYVQRATLQALVKSQSENPGAMLWTPSFERQAGHPVIFSSRLMAELGTSPLQEGARPVVRRHHSRRHWVEVDDPSVLWDVDTPQDYEEYSARYAESFKE